MKRCMGPFLLTPCLVTADATPRWHKMSREGTCGRKDADADGRTTSCALCAAQRRNGKCLNEARGRKQERAWRERDREALLCESHVVTASDNDVDRHVPFC